MLDLVGGNAFSVDPGHCGVTVSEKKQQRQGQLWIGYEKGYARGIGQHQDGRYRLLGEETELKSIIR